MLSTEFLFSYNAFFGEYRNKKALKINDLSAFDSE